MTERPFDRLAAGLDESLAAHGVPAKERRELPHRGEAFAAQARRAREAAEGMVDVDRLTHRNNTNRTR